MDPRQRPSHFMLYPWRTVRSITVDHIQLRAAIEEQTILAAEQPPKINELGSKPIAVCIDKRLKGWDGFIVLSASSFDGYDTSMAPKLANVTLACFDPTRRSSYRRLADAAIVVMDAKGPERDRLVARTSLYSVQDGQVSDRIQSKPVPQLVFSSRE